MARLKLHIESEEASMTPTELHEHLAEVPDQLFREAEELSWDIWSKMRELVETYIVRHGDWERDEFFDEYTDDDGQLDEGIIRDEFCQEIDRLTNELLADFFSS